ncbi:MAG: redoxin domain-containing protein [Opitutaceae bacterium]|nr:redoxin domain-containing protein [Opitutaceae bacterium]
MRLLPTTRLQALRAVSLLALSAPLFAATEVSNFVLLDQRGTAFELRRSDARAVVLFFTANGCPVARQYAAKLKVMRDDYAARGADIVMVNSSSGDDRASILKEMRELRAPFLPVLKDDTQGLARHLRVNRTGEAVAISTKDWTVFYRGAVDDQVIEGAQKPAPTERHLETALTEFLAGHAITTAKTVARGCVISFDGGEGPDTAPVSYAKHVAPILQKNCVSCHSPGNIGSWSMNGHRKIKSMAGMIEEVLLTRRMPPWDADPAIGKFANHTALPLADAQTLLRWVHQGAPRGEGDDPLASLPAAPPPSWPLGQPDIVLRLPKPEEIPATGVLKYRHVKVNAGNAAPGWVGGFWVRPGNNKVLHHVIARVIGGGNRSERAPSGIVEMFVAWAPGATQGAFPPNSGKPIPANAVFDLELHYTTIGTPQTDQTEIGLYLLKEKPALRYESIPIANDTFEIAPGDANAPVQATFPFRRGATLHSVTPHMHLRGRSMKFELLGTDGRREVIASVPRYDFNWQLTYQLATPRKIPAGSWALLSGTFDNSKRNPANPDPNRTIRWGDQTFDEMFLGFYSVTWDPETAPTPKAAAAKTEE